MAPRTASPCPQGAAGRTLAAAACCLLGLVACGSSEKPPVTPDEANTSNTTSSVPPPPAPAAPPAGETAKETADSAMRRAHTREPASDVLSTSKGDVTIAPIYHGSLTLTLAGKVTYVDPWLAQGAVDYSKMPKADYVLITDIHPDHLDPKALESIVTTSTTIVAPPAVAKELGARSHLVVLKNGQSAEVGPMNVLAFPMYNLVRGPSAGKLFHDKGRGNGYVVTIGDKRIYISGDTECTPEMKALKNIDVALVSMNLPYTMPPSEAAACVNAFKPKTLYPYHYAAPGGATSNLDELTSAVEPSAHVEVRKREWYAKPSTAQ